MNGRKFRSLRITNHADGRFCGHPLSSITRGVFKVALKISRDSGYADRLRAYAVIVDGRKLGELRNGETRLLSVSPGSHEVSLKMDGCGSKTLSFTATEGCPLAFRGSSNLRGPRLLLAFWYAVVARDSYLLVEQIAS